MQVARFRMNWLGTGLSFGLLVWAGAVSVKAMWGAESPGNAETVQKPPPLKVVVTRSGTCLQIEPREASGGRARVPRGAQRPTFTVSRGETVLGTGTFEYG